MRLALWLLIPLCNQLGAQAPSPSPAAAPKPPDLSLLTNNGEPIRVPFQCSMDDMEWAGMSCSEQEPCPVYLELAALESVGNRIFVAGNIHSNAVTMYSVLLTSDDAGKTWREPYDRLRGAELDHIQFIDYETGWVSGQVLVPFAQDPFMLITSDSGKTWRKRPVFGENRAGTIAQFWFSSRTSGTLLIDRSQSGDDSRYELYESMTGGESWMLRETNDKQIKLKHVFVPNTDWRIRADGASKSFRIERRQGEKWTTLASFLVPIAACKPPEEKAAPPVTETAEPEPVAPPQSRPTSKRPAPSLKRPRK
jgi:hypothetical protein